MMHPTPLRATLFFIFSLMAFLAAAIPAQAQSETYIVRSIDVAPSVNTEGLTVNTDALEEIKNTTWIELDSTAGRLETYSIQSRDPLIGTFNSDATSFLNDGQQQPVGFTRIDVNTFSIRTDGILPLETVFHRVNADSAELAAVRAARQAEFDQRDARIAEQQQILENFTAAPAAKLGLRLPLNNDTSIAMPHDYTLTGHSKRYEILHRTPEFAVAAVLNIIVHGPQDFGVWQDDFANAKEVVAGWNDTPNFVNNDAIYWVADGTVFRLYGQTIRGDTAYQFSGEAVSEEEFEMLLAIWAGLGDPVTAPQLSSVPVGTVFDDAIDVAEFDSQIDAVFSELSKPHSLSEQTEYTLDQPSPFLEAEVFITQDQASDGKLAALILAGSPADVLAPYTPYSGENTKVAVQLQGTTCRAMAAYPVNLGTDNAPYSLVVQQASASSFNTCFAFAQTLASFGNDRTFAAPINANLLAHFDRFQSTDALDNDAADGAFTFKEDGLWGIMSAQGDIILPARYDFIRQHRTGLELETDGLASLANLQGELILNGPFEDVDFSENLIVTTRNQKQSAYDLAGVEIIAPHDRIYEWPDRPGFAHVYDGDIVGLFDIAQKRFVLPLDEGITDIDDIRGMDRLIVEHSNGHESLYDFQGTAFLIAAEMRLDGPDILSVRLEQDGPVQLYDLDGNLLLPDEFASTWPHDGAIFLRKENGERYYIDHALERITPEGLEGVFSPTDGYGVVRVPDGLYGMGGPDRQLVLPTQYRAVFSLREGLIVAQTQQGLWGLWDQTGAQVLAPDWSALSQSFGGQIFAQRGATWQIIDKTGTPVDPRRWSAVEILRGNAFDETIFVAAQILSQDNEDPARPNGKWEMLDMQGQRLIEPVFDAIDLTRYGMSHDLFLIQNGVRKEFPYEFY